MSDTASMVKGWCPGVLRPMRSGDGLLARVRPHGGLLDATALAVLARAALELGNGLVDLTTQANLQLRGLDEGSVLELAARLRPLGLLDDSAAQEARRNILVSPLADVDPLRLLDVALLVKALAEALRESHALASLPAKFSFLVDAGGALPLGDARADIRFEAFLQRGDVQFLVKLAGDSASGQVVGQCAPHALVAVALALALAQSCGRLQACGLLPLPAADLPPARAATCPDDCLRLLPCDTGTCLGALAPYGRLSGTMLAALADTTAQAGGAPLRLTPWRCVLVPLASLAQAHSVRQQLSGAGFVLQGGDPRARIAACAGAPACASATVPVRQDADFFARALDQPCGAHQAQGISLHVSGCAKGCAHHKPAPVTLVGRAGGYDLVLGGSAGDRASAVGLTRAMVLSRLAALYAEPEQVT